MLWENIEFMVEMTVGKLRSERERERKSERRLKSVKNSTTKKKPHALNEKREWNSTYECLFYYYAQSAMEYHYIYNRKKSI